MPYINETHEAKRSKESIDWNENPSHFLGMCSLQQQRTLSEQGLWSYSELHSLESILWLRLSLGTPFVNAVQPGLSHRSRAARAMSPWGNMGQCVGIPRWCLAYNVEPVTMAITSALVTCLPLKEDTAVLVRTPFLETLRELYQCEGLVWQSRAWNIGPWCMVFCSLLWNIIFWLMDTLTVIESGPIRDEESSVDQYLLDSKTYI